ncbi:hypothetical protein FGIG_01583, partial [Fasciola gigantica]
SLKSVPITEGDFCDPNPCANGGTCVRPLHKAARMLNPDGSPHSTYQCICPNGWGGQNCTEDLNDCADQPCLNGGVCENQLNMRYICHCGPDFVGQNCEYTNPCKANPCENGGSCQADVLGRFTCDCPKWYQGERCELELDPCHRVNPCQGPNSKCHLIRDDHRNTVEGLGRLLDFRCECSSGYKGRYCEKHEDPCTKINCTNGGRCFYLGNQTMCICPSGFAGPICEFGQDSALKAATNEVRVVNSQIGPDPPILTPKSDMCEQAGCMFGTQYTDRVCRADCVLKGCLGLDAMQDCPYWQACLAASTTQSATSIQESCLGKFRNEQCDSVCNVPECYHDGLDCWESRTTCEQKQYCSEHYGDGICQSQCNDPVCGFDGGDCLYTKLPTDPYILRTPTSTPTPLSPEMLREPILFLTVLNTMTAQFIQQRASFLSTLGMLVRGVARVWRNPRNDRELVLDLPDSGEMKIVFAIWLCPPTIRNISECTNPLVRRTPRAVGEFIQSTFNLDHTELKKPRRRPIVMKRLTPIEDSGQLEFVSTMEPQWSKFLRSKEAIGIYVCLCILAGIIIILVIFLVLQRDPWHKPTKRVFTTGIWCPPVPISLKQEVRQLGHLSGGYVRSSSRDPATSYKQCESLLSSFTGDRQNVEMQNKYDQISVGNFADVVDTGIKIDTNSIQQLVKPPENRLKRRFLENDLLPSEEAFIDQIGPPSKSMCFNHKPVPEDIRTRMTLRKTESNGSAKSKYVFYGTAKDNSSAENHQPESSSEVCNHLFGLLKSQDGLHPIDPRDVISVEDTFQKSVREIPEQERRTRPTLSGRNEKNQASSNTTRAAVRKLTESDERQDVGKNKETILHLAGRMNSGKEMVHLLQQSMQRDQLNYAVTMPDDTGRTALALAASANAMETVGAIYQLEKEAVVNSKIQSGSKSNENSSLNAMTTTFTQATNTGVTSRSRRRQKQSEPRHCTPLISAVQAGNQEVAHYLIEEGHPLTGVDELGRNVVHWAAATNDLTLLQRLAQCKGFNRLVNARDDHDQTPLMLAVREGWERTVQFMLDHKASVLTSDCNENDPLKIAKLKGFTNIERVLSKYYNSEGCPVGLPESSSHGPYHESPFGRITESVSEISEFDTQSIGVDSTELQQAGLSSAKHHSRS